MRKTKKKLTEGAFVFMNPMGLDLSYDGRNLIIPVEDDEIVALKEKAAGNLITMLTIEWRKGK